MRSLDDIVRAAGLFVLGALVVALTLVPFWLALLTLD
jgi:hypothetical protein